LSDKKREELRKLTQHIFKFLVSKDSEAFLDGVEVLSKFFTEVNWSQKMLGDYLQDIENSAIEATGDENIGHWPRLRLKAQRAKIQLPRIH